MCGTDSRIDRSQLTSVWKSDVVNAFDRAADKYDKLANVQRDVADELAKTIFKKTEVSQVKTALEVGCGTGFLTSQLLSHFTTTHWVVSDVSPKMVQVCRQSVEEVLDRGRVNYQALDGEQLKNLVAKSRSFDLICSSLAFQWFSDLPNALSGMFDRLNGGGQVHFSTLADSNFRHLHDCFPLSGLEDRAPKFPSVSAIEAALQEVGATEIEIGERRYSEAYPNLQSLLRHLKSIGASTAGQRSDLPNIAGDNIAARNSVAALRSAIRESRASGHRAIADYHVLIVSAKKEG